VRICGSEEKVIGSRLLTCWAASWSPSRPARGQAGHRLYVEEATDIAQELYLGFVLDRASERIMLVASARAAWRSRRSPNRTPDSIMRSVGRSGRRECQNFQARELAFQPRLSTRQAGRPGREDDHDGAAIAAIATLDAIMVEINPLVDHRRGRGDRARRQDELRRQRAVPSPAVIAELRDKSQEDPRETFAADQGLAYVGPDGEIGCIINGAGLAMATMDMIKLAGGEPANFLDIGGGASPERVLMAFRTVLATIPTWR
jgi:malate-CoA ligase subunit beta